MKTNERCVYHRVMPDGLAIDVSAFILAGGRSSRMGSDKALLEFESRTLLARSLDLVGALTSTVCVVASRKKFGGFGSVIEDIFSDCGPLGAIHAALRSSQTELNLMLAVDMPFVTLDFLRFLVGEARKAPSATVVLPELHNRKQTLCAIYRREFAGIAERALREGRNKIDPLFDSLPIRLIGEAELLAAGFSSDIFCNLNTPDELQMAKLHPLSQEVRS